MKKKVAIFMTILLFSLSILPFTKTNASENKQVNKEDSIISIDVIYDTWEDARDAGEFYKFDNNGSAEFLKAKCAHVIENTKKFIVTYSNENSIISIDVIYDTWEDARDAGEFYEFDNDGSTKVLQAKCANRIENTEKFIVTYSDKKY
ncbi:MAG: hypothetical protein ACERKN_12675 [Velocimicrobium sp.]